jgi:hypothetical protein
MKDVGLRLAIFLKIRKLDGSDQYISDTSLSNGDERFQHLFRLLFGADLDPKPGQFAIRPLDSSSFTADAVLGELLEGFDRISNMGWIETQREGDTGIGYTFETLMGLKENNDQEADFKGIEIKCKGVKEGEKTSSQKINLFQSAPIWMEKDSAKTRLRKIGQVGEDGRYRCHSQVTARRNNIGLLLEILNAEEKILLRKNTLTIGFWPFALLSKRLREKHSRAVFIKAKVRNENSRSQFKFEQLIYCERPSIFQFVRLVSERSIVFEFLMSETEKGHVRNRGYPWRLVREQLLEQLFSFQIRLRGED